MRRCDCQNKRANPAGFAFLFPNCGELDSVQSLPATIASYRDSQHGCRVSPVIPHQVGQRAPFVPSIMNLHSMAVQGKIVADPPEAIVCFSFWEISLPLPDGTAD